MKLKKLIITAIFSALAIVLYEFADIKFPPTQTFLTISLGILPIFIIAYTCGIMYATIGAVVVDLLGFLIAGSAFNTFYWGFTFNAMLSGLILGVVLKYKEKLKGKMGKIIIIITETLISVITIPIFIYYFYKAGVPSKYDNENIGYILSVFALISNFAVTIYSLATEKEEYSNAVHISYIFYQLIVSLILTPLWVNNLYHVTYIYQWASRLITAPILVIIYSVLTRLIMIPLKFTLDRIDKKNKRESE